MENSVDWQTPTAHPMLAAGQVHIWRCNLNVAEHTLDTLHHLLSSDEQDRAQRFVFERDRRRYIVARGVLRRLLAAYSGVAASDLVFGYAEHGKPFLNAPDNATGISFNLSHSAEWAVYGFTRQGRQGRIGIDIEYHRNLNDMSQLAASVFAEQELAAWQSVPTVQQQAAFYAGWTRKEAFIKAVGTGLALSLKRFVVSLHPDEPARLLHIDTDLVSAQPWHIASFTPAPDISGAVVVEGPQMEMLYWHFSYG